MGLDDGEWVHDESAGGEGTAGYEEPGGEGPGGEGPGGEGPGGEGPGRIGRRGNGGFSGFSVRAAAVVALLAAAAGVAVGLFIFRGTGSVQGAGTTPSASAPSQGGVGLPALPGLSGGGNGRLQILLTGRVLAVSDKSITIGGNGPSVTAAVTAATKVSGAVSGIGAVKVGAEVSAQVTGTGDDLTATAIQDPAAA